ncbi:MAG: AAA family ATPase, partial [Clostridium sp.]|nr:AAA family ATPase [Clostridium sp.]
MKTRALPLGHSDFQSIREKDYYYIDKTLFIEEFLSSRDEVTIITRPRRFGKTLNMFMLSCFCDQDLDSRNIFEGLAIMDTAYADRMNRFPVIVLSFKDAKQDNFMSLLFGIFESIQYWFFKYREIYDSFKMQKNNVQTKIYEDYICIFEYFEQVKSLKKQLAIRNDSTEKNIFIDNLSNSLLALTKAIATYYKKKPLVLIDEYDTPILTAYTNHFHREMEDFFAVLYGSALKDHSYLEKVLLIGIQRVAKETVFSELNNLCVYNVLSEKYSSYFGFTEAETAKLLEDCGLLLDEAVQRQYNGYVFGSCPVYNPWSILNYAAD